MKFGLIGHPIAHSLSPALFKAGYDGRYPYDLIETADFEEAYSRFLNEYDGINITTPFKELAFHKADILSEECQRIGAANLLIKTPEGTKAHNSDFLGVRLWLSEISKEYSHTPTVLIAGLGGAGKAAAMAASSLGFRLILMNRDMSKAEALAAKNDLEKAETLPLESFSEAFCKADIIIYNIPTSIPQIGGLYGKDFNGKKHVLEANYKDPTFIKELISNILKSNPDITYISGKTWLLYQALTGYELFTGEKPDLIKMSDIISESL